MKTQKKMKLSLRAKLLSVFLAIGVTAILEQLVFTMTSDLQYNARIAIGSILVIGMFLGYLVLKSAIEHLQKLNEILTANANRVADFAKEVNSASANLAQSNTEHAAAIEQTVASMEEMTAMVSQNTQNSDGSLVVVEKGRKDAEQGKEVAAKLILSMDDIERSNKGLESVVRIINEIGNRTKVINDIVFETRLLSFNASIEAARAGAHGKGFAVVAEEVGKLATMSGKAADEIRTLLESSTYEVGIVVSETMNKVKLGRTVSEECSAAFKRIHESLKDIGQSVSGIVTATKEQELGIKEANKAMHEMDRVTQRNSGNSDKLAAIAEHLEQEALTLSHTVGSIQHAITHTPKNRSEMTKNTATDHQLEKANLDLAIKNGSLSSPPSASAPVKITRDHPIFKKVA